MATKTNIFILGATGYIGGAFLTRLLEHPQISNFDITALTRSPEKAEKLKDVGVKAVVGSHSDLDKIEELAAASDVVAALADADDLPLAQAVLKGLKRRHEATGKPPILIHTSGTGVLSDDAGGMYSYDTIWNDADPQQMATLAPTQFHREIDLTILQADQEGYVRTHIVLPSTIYGIATGRVFDLGIANKQSIQIPALVYVSLDRGRGGMVGEGKNLWPNVNIDDLGELYLTLFNAALDNPSTDHGLNGYYFGENGEHSLYDIGKAIGEAMFELGKTPAAEPTPFTDEEIRKYFGGSKYLGSNSRCKSNHPRALGWKPTKTTKDMLASIRTEVEILLKLGKSYDATKNQALRLAHD